VVIPKYLLDETLISSASKKQRIVVLSTAEAEYMALTKCIKEGQWFNGVLDEANKHMEYFVEQPIAIKEENMSTIAMTKQANNHKN
jgi:hypothetical protein